MTTYNNSTNCISPNIAAHSLVISEGPTTAQAGLLLTAGQVPIGTTSGDPVGAQITGSGNITVTSGSGTINISSSGPASFSWVSQASTPVTTVVNTGYIITDASTVTATLPVTAPVGSIVAIVGNGAGGWILAPGAGQTIKLGDVSASTSVASSNQYDTIEVICTVANTTWVARNWVGNLSYA